MVTPGEVASCSQGNVNTFTWENVNMVIWSSWSPGKNRAQNGCGRQHPAGRVGCCKLPPAWTASCGRRGLQAAAATRCRPQLQPGAAAAAEEIPGDPVNSPPTDLGMPLYVPLRSNQCREPASGGTSPVRRWKGSTRSVRPAALASDLGRGPARAEEGGGQQVSQATPGTPAAARIGSN